MREFAGLLRKALSLPHVALFNSGFHALETVFKIIGAVPDDEVILPSYSRYRILGSIMRAGLKPVLVDIEEDNFLPLKKDVERKVTGKTRCIIVNQMFGLPNDLGTYRTFGIPIVEELDGALSARIANRKIGSFGDFVTMHFNDDAIITTGNGGMLASRDQGLRRFVLSHSEDAMSTDYLMSDFNASLGIAQLKKLDRMVETRKKIGVFYDDAVYASNGTFVGRTDGQDLCYSSYVLKTDAPFADIEAFFKKYHIPVRRGIAAPLHRSLKLDMKDFKNTEELYARTIELPIYPLLRKEHVENVARCIRAVL